MIKIGYQGIEGSNAEQAAHELVEKLKLTDVEYVPLVDSPHVITAMKKGETDYGVCAVYNSAAGMVLETFFATNGVELLIKGETTLTIHHCLFKRALISLMKACAMLLRTFSPSNSARII